MAGQDAHVITFLAVLALGLHFGQPGWQMGMTAVLSAAAATIVVLHFALSTRFTRAG